MGECVGGCATLYPIPPVIISPAAVPTCARQLTPRASVEGQKCALLISDGPQRGFVS